MEMKIFQMVTLGHRSAPAHRFFPGLKFQEAVQIAHWRTMASFVMPFFLHMYACAQIT